RWRRFRQADRESRALLEELSARQGFTGLIEFSRSLRHSPLAALYFAFMSEVERFQTRGVLAPDGMPLSSNPGHLDPRVRVPLVHVMLVLLIIFMVAAPMMTRGIDVELPRTVSADPLEEQRVEVSLDNEGKLWLGERLVHEELLREEMQRLARRRPGAGVFLK